MKLKISQLLLLFLITGLFVSSKQTVDKTQSTCRFKCLKEEKFVNKSDDKEQKQMANYQLAVAPGSYIFFY